MDLTRLTRQPKERGQPCPRLAARTPPTGGLGGPRSFGCCAVALCPAVVDEAALDKSHQDVR
jgi:hypothetical protein